MQWQTITSSGVLAAGLIADGAIAQGDPDFGFEFVTIGDVGNRNTIDGEHAPFYANAYVGAVDYEFRIATLEVTVGQYFEFAQVYHPYYTANTGNVLGHDAFTGGDICLAWGDISICDGVSPDRPIYMSWEYAARFVNWLHNGKVNEEWAFETGVYDTSTFTQNPDETWNHQATHDPEARFWLPTRDEWTKAAYWDPEKDNGQGGYWLFPNGSDIESLPIIEKNARLDPPIPFDVGSFPDVTSPWGIFDMAGGEKEWTETVAGGGTRTRHLLGSDHFHIEVGDIFSDDYVGNGGSGLVFFGIGAIRLASPVPSLADLNEDGHVNYFDISAFISRFAEGDLVVDFDGDGDLDIDDVLMFLELMNN